MARLQLIDGDLVHVTSRRGSIVLPARASAAMAPMQAFIAMHWGDEFVGGSSAIGAPLAGVNALTAERLLPAVEAARAEACRGKGAQGRIAVAAASRWRGCRRRPRAARAPAAADARLRLRELRAVRPRARRRAVPRRRARAGKPTRCIGQLEALLELRGEKALRYVDRRRGQRRTLRLDYGGDDIRLDALLLAGDTGAEAWLRPLLQDQRSVAPYRRRLLSPSATAPADIAARGRQVCTCHDVCGAADRRGARKSAGTTDERVAQLQRTLACGTSCGSCLPELKRLAQRPALAA